MDLGRAVTTALQHVRTAAPGPKGQAGQAESHGQAGTRERPSRRAKSRVRHQDDA